MLRIILLLLGAFGVLLSMAAVNRVFDGDSMLWLWAPVSVIFLLVEYIKEKRT